jgi:type I restriction enzyme S subunit
MTFSVRKVTLGDVCEIKQGRYLAPNQMEPVPTTECFVPVVGGNGVLGFTDQSTFSFPVPLVTCRGSKCGLMQWAEPPTWISNNAMAVYFKKNQGDNFFLHQYLLHSSFDDVTTGSAQPQITVTNLSLKQILLPDLQTQTTISLIMKSLEEKISSNNALSKTLEEIAQTIFKSWFLDFDPVKAKMAGEKPAGMDAATAPLFPDSMEESELGLIPKGWVWGIIGDIADVIDCLHAKKPELIDQGQPYLQLDTISDAGVLKFENAAKISKSDYEKWTSRIEVSGGDCLITNVGRVGAISQVPDHFKAAIGRNITAIRPKDFANHKSFLVTALLSNYMKKEILRNTDSGTILEALNVKNIPNLRVPIPSDEVFQLFENFCGPIRQLLNALHQQSVQLRLTRDALLPRLISGELQIPEEMLAS